MVMVVVAATLFVRRRLRCLLLFLPLVLLLRCLLLLQLLLLRCLLLLVLILLLPRQPLGKRPKRRRRWR